MNNDLNDLKDLAKGLRLVLERSNGETYSGDNPVLYGYGSYPKHSVFRGRVMRVFLESWDSWDEARAELKAAKIRYTDEGENGASGHIPMSDMVAGIPDELGD